MSNSFPNMICNEPPPLDQSEDEDDDSEEIRNFSSGLKLDIDPSPMSTPQKSGGNRSSPSSTNLPIPNGISTPDLLPVNNDNFDFTDSRTCCFEGDSMQESWIGNNSKPSKNLPPLNINTIMKTSYIGTMESEALGMGTDDVVLNQGPTDNASEDNIQVDFKVENGAAAVDDFADFSEPIVPQSPPTDGNLSTPTTLQAEVINSPQAQDHLLDDGSTSDVIPFTPITTTTTVCDGVDFDFDDFQEFKSITKTEVIKDEVSVSTLVQGHSDTDTIECDTSEQTEVVVELDERETILFDSAESELESKPELTEAISNININHIHRPDDQPPPSPTLAEEAKFEDDKSDVEEPETFASEIKTPEIQIIPEPEIGSLGDAHVKIHNLGENENPDSDDFKDVDNAPLEIPAAETPVENTGLETLDVAAERAVENSKLEISDAVMETFDSFDADFGDFAAFESSPQVESTVLQASLDDNNISSATPVFEQLNVNQNGVSRDSDSISSSELHPAIKKSFDATDEDEVQFTLESQLQSESQPPHATVASKGLPVENSSSSNFHSFSEDDDGDGDDDDFDDFQAFQSTSTSAATAVSPVKPPALPSCSSVSASAATQTQVPLVALASTSPLITTSPSQFPSVLIPNPKTEDTSAPVAFVRRGSLMEDKFENLVKSLFVVRSDSTDAGVGSDNSEPQSSVLCSDINMNPIDKELKENDKNEEWNRVEDFEGSQGLLFKWPNSTAYQRLLQSLKIDNSTIVYSGKWGAIEVPRFAASLVDSPLLPVQESGTKFKDNISPCNPDSGTGSPVVNKSTSSSGSDQPVSSTTDNDCAVQLQTNTGTDTTVNGGVKPLGCHISAEAEQILNQLPDLSFMRAKTLVFPNNTLQTISRDV